MPFRKMASGLSELGLQPHQARSCWRSARRDRGHLARNAFTSGCTAAASGSSARLASSPRYNRNTDRPLSIDQASMVRFERDGGWMESLAAAQA